MTDKKAPLLDQIYNDQCASATLISSDDIEFKVDPYPLKKGSTVFKDIFSDPKMTPSTIPVDMASEDLRTLLSFLDLGELIEPTSMEGWRRLIEGADKFECHTVRKRLREIIQIKAFNAPWKAFCLASHLQDDELAKDAILLLGSDAKSEAIRLEDMSMDMAKQISAPYLLGLLQALRSQMHEEGSRW